MESSRSRTRVAFLGPLASFSHQAALESFGSDSTLLPQPSFADAFQAVQSNAADYAVIPFENSTNGSVVQTLDLLADRDGLYRNISVCGEYYLTVHHSLMVKKTEGNGVINPTLDQRYKSITKLYTHPQAWGQCETFLSAHFKGVERQDVSSTSKAAEIVSKESGHSSAAIASKFAADFHGLEVLAENIEDQADNSTRFLVLENTEAENRERKDSNNFPPGLPKSPIEGRPKKYKSLISFMIDHNSPGALVHALKVFEKYGMNLTSINSRPGLVKPWQYVFFVECARIPGVHGDNAVGDVMKNLQEVTETCRDLGSWRDQLKTSS